MAPVSTGNRSKGRVRGSGSAVSTEPFVVSLDPVELLNYDRAGRECVRVLVWEVAREENLGKTRSRSSRLARILSGGDDEVVDHLSGALDALSRDTAALRFAEDKSTGLRMLCRIGGLGDADPGDEEQGGWKGKS